MQKIIEIMLKLLKSRTVWSGIITTISLVVYFKTGYFIEVTDSSPEITDAVEKVSLLLAVLGQIGNMVFRLMATAGLEENAKKATESLNQIISVSDADGKSGLELIEEAIEILRGKK
jgi:uncharacterized membrane protein